MALQADKTKDQRDVASIAAEARGLFEGWAAEEETSYTGEVSREEFEGEINVAVGHLTAGPSERIRRSA